LSVDPPECHSIPSIDVLFESAAYVYKQALIGVILTGANRDGSAGIAQIKKLGGLAIVQDPCSAQSPEMPQAAIASTTVDHILALNQIGNFLASVVSMAD
jgi:two-component system, chemotaxis family, protein-glutamate methylesterase/glutaminase